MSGILDAVGDVAQGAYDFIAPRTERQGQGLDLGNMINSVGEAFQDSPLGALAKLPQLVQSDSGWGEKLLLSGAIAAGGFASARHYFGAAKVERELASAAEAGMLAARPARSAEGRAIGLSERYVPSTIEGEAVRAKWPGINARTADVLGAKDWNTTVRHMTDLPEEQLAYAGGVLEQYSQRLVDIDPAQRFGAAQGDWAKMHLALESGLITKGRNARLDALWTKFSTTPQALQPGEAMELQDMVFSLGDATRGIIQPDMSFDIASKVGQIDMTPMGPVVHITSPFGWGDGLSVDPKVRSARLKEMNLRQLADRAEGILKYLYQEGTRDPDRFLERTDNWYQNVHDEIAQTLSTVQAKHPKIDMERFTAAVSLTSEATDWDQNIPMAIAALDTIASHPKFTTPEFQSWLRDAKSVKPAEAAEFDRLFTKAHDEVTAKAQKEAFDLRKKAAKEAWKKTPAAHRKPFDEYFTEKSPGNFLSTGDLKKVMRLYEQSGQEVFASMPGAPKQKSFYLNMLDPGNPDPVTVDRHAYDIFFGLATHSDFKGLEGLNLGDSNYEVIADVYRKVARDLGIMPHEVQGTTWQTWRVMKEDWNYRSHDYVNGRGPFRLPEPDGSPNVVWETLNGRANPGVKDPYSLMPEKLVWVTGGQGAGPYVLPDGSAGLAMRHTREAADQFRTLFPAVTRTDGVSMYMSGRPQMVSDVSALGAQLEQRVGGNYIAERTSVNAWGGLHPAEANTPTIVFEPGDGPLPQDLQQRLVPSGEPTLVDVPDGIPAGLRPATMDEFLVSRRYLNQGTERKGGTTVDKMLSGIPENPVDDWKDHRFWMNADGTAGFAIAPDGDLQQVFNVSGVRGYGGDMVEYAKSQGAKKLDFFDGEFLDDGTVGPGMLKQFYSARGFTETVRDPWNPKHDPQGRAVGPDVQYMELPEEANVLPKRRTSSVQRFAITPSQSELQDVSKLLMKLEGAGARIHGVYAPGAPPAGWKVAREHVYSDGVNKMVVRTADPETLSHHGYGVWVRDADHAMLPKSNPLGQRFSAERVMPEPMPNAPGVFRYGQLATGANIFDPKLKVFTVAHRPDGVASFSPVIADTAMPYDGAGRVLTPGQVRKVGNKFNITAVDPGDITEEVKTLDLLGALGVPKKDIVFNVGEDAARMDFPDPKVSRKGVPTTFGYEVRPLRKTGMPLADWRNKYGLWVDVHARRPNDGRLVTMSDEHVPYLDDATSTFYSDTVHVEMAKMAGFDGIHLGFDTPSGSDAAAFAWYVPQHGGRIALGGDYFVEPGKMLKAVMESQQSGHLNPNMPTHSGAILAHELGHMMRTALILSHRTKGEYAVFEKELKSLFNSLGAAGRATKVSGYGAQNLDEFLAETLSEAFYSPTPRAVSRQVYKIVMDQFNANKAPAKVSWTAWGGN